MLRLRSNVTYPGHARLATDRRLLEGDNWNCGCDRAIATSTLRWSHAILPLERAKIIVVSDRFGESSACANGD